jgi:PKD repeat protein
MRDRRVPVIVALVVLAPVVGSVVVSAAPVENDSYAVAQGTTCTVVEPVTDPSRNVSSFYDYRNPSPNITGNPPADTFSSYGTREYQETGVSTLLFYEGSVGASLVLVHGELGDEAGGSTLTMSFAGLPDGEWVVEDDEYPLRDDDWVVDGDGGTIDWKWGPNRTDGGAYRGIGNASGPLTITPAFNEEAAHWGEWTYSGSDEYRLTEWRVIGADGTETTLDRDRRVFVHGGECESTPPSAALGGPSNATTTETVTLDASGSTDDDAIGGYEWDLDGDGAVETVTAEPTLEHTFSLPGDRTVTVTAFDRYGNGDTATLTVNVTIPATPPTPELDAPELTTVNQSITLDAGNSSDEGTITEYRWDVDGDGAIETVSTDPTLDHTYTQVGTVEPAVTVVDNDNETATASATVTVRPPNRPPNASLDAPAVVNESEPVTLDASNSTDDRGIETYRWDPDSDGEFESETAEPTLEWAYEEPVNVTARVRVVDTDGEGDIATATIDVLPVNDPPTAALAGTGPATVDVPVTFDARNTTDEEGIDTYRWDFDADGAVERTTTDPIAQYTYRNLSSDVTAAVTVVDTGGLNDTARTTFDVLPPDQPPNASLIGPANATAGEATTFDASNSSDDRGIETYRWDFDGDGAVENETSSPVIDHVYERGGTFDVTVTVVDSGRQTATASTTTAVVVPPSPPTAALDAPAEAPVNRSVTLDASNASDEGRITEYRWDLDGDGSVERTTTTATVDHTYTELGTVQPAVTVVDDDNETDTASAEVDVIEVNFPPTARLDAPDEVDVDETVVFDASASSDDRGIGTYRWDFDGDGAVDRETTEPTVEHTYTDAARVTVEVTVVGVDEQTATATSSVTVGNPGGNNGGGNNGGGGQSGGGQSGGGQSGGGQSGGGQSGGASEEDTPDEPSPEPDIGQANVTMGSTELLVGQTLVVEATVANRGNGSGTKTVEFEVEGEMVEVREIPLGPGENRTVAFTHQFTTPGEKRVEVDHGRTRTIVVRPREPDISVATLKVDRQEVRAGQEFTLTANVSNTGDAAGERSVSLELFGETVATRTVSLAAGESTTVSFTRSVMSPGSYEATLGNQTVTVTVVGGGTPTEAGSTTTEAPGFGAMGALLALLAVAVAVERRRR